MKLLMCPYNRCQQSPFLCRYHMVITVVLYVSYTLRALAHKTVAGRLAKKIRKNPSEERHQTVVLYFCLKFSFAIRGIKSETFTYLSPV